MAVAGRGGAGEGVGGVFGVRRVGGGGLGCWEGGGFGGDRRGGVSGRGVFGGAGRSVSGGAGGGGCAGRAVPLRGRGAAESGSEEGLGRGQSWAWRVREGEEEVREALRGGGERCGGCLWTEAKDVPWGAGRGLVPEERTRGCCRGSGEMGGGGGAGLRQGLWGGIVWWEGRGWSRVPALGGSRWHWDGMVL